MSTVSQAGRSVIVRAAGDPILRRVVAVGLLGASLATLVVLHMAHRDSVLAGIGLPLTWLVPALVALTCLAEVTVVRLRHGDAEEELTLYEAALIIDVLLLPPRHALLAATAGLVVASLVLRRPIVKAAFNVGTYTAAMSGLIIVVHAVGGTPGVMTAGVLAGVVAGTLVFTAVNLGCLAQILSVVSGAPWWTIVRSEARLSAYMAVGTVATGLTTAEIAHHSPLLLPLMAMPALAVTYAYRAAAQEADERARSTTLLALSHALAERDDVVRRFLVLVREAFRGDQTVVVLTDAGTALSVDAAAPEELRTEPIPGYLAGLRNVDRPTFVSDGLPAPLRQLLVVPLEAGGRRIGLAGVAVRERRRARLTTRDATLLAPLGNALAVAMRGAEHLDRLVEETSKLQAIVEQSTEGIGMVDGQGVVQMWSRALADMTGVPAAAAVGRPLAELLDLVDPHEPDRLLPVSPQRPTNAVEVTIRRPDGDHRRLRLAHSAAYAGDSLLRDVVVITDLTREHRTERLKADFIATVSHELRTPLTPIMGYVGLLRTRGDRMPPNKRADALAMIADRAAHLSRLVEDLLLASRMSDADDELALHVSAGRHDLADIVRQTVADLHTTRVTVDLPEGAVAVDCDRDRTMQILANLLGNALKYSPDPAPVRVRLRADADRVDLEVADQGRGIPADQLEKIFDKFHRVEDPMTMTTSGTGLGLFIARRLARAMGGDITVTSALNQGSVFTLTLPPAHAEANPVASGADGTTYPSAAPGQPHDEGIR